MSEIFQLFLTITRSWYISKVFHNMTLSTLAVSSLLPLLSNLLVLEGVSAFFCHQAFAHSVPTIPWIPNWWSLLLVLEKSFFKDHLFGKSFLMPAYFLPRDCIPSMFFINLHKPLELFVYLFIQPARLWTSWM